MASIKNITEASFALLRGPWLRERRAERHRIRLLAPFLGILLLPCLHVSAFPIRLRIDELAKLSDTIVVAKVESVRRIPVVGKRWAKARVIEVWKGPKLEIVEFLASASDPCDISDAKRHETVLLFLTKEKDLGWIIEGSGRGRMPVCVINGKKCVTYSNIIFPRDTPRIDVPDGSSDFKSGIELGTVRVLVEKTLEGAR